MKLFHGSSLIVENPELSKGKPNNDYGRGFYCTESVEMAREWACKGKVPPAFVNAYELDLEGLTVLDLSKPPYTILDWMAVLLANRTFELDLEVAVEIRDYLLAHFLPPVDEADVVIGYRADDSYFNFASAFVNNGLPVARLNDALRLGRLGLQVALRSEKAFGRLAFQGSEEVDWELYHKRYVTRDASAREEWRRVKARGMMAGDVVFAYDILRRGVKHDDERLSEILPA